MCELALLSCVLSLHHKDNLLRETTGDTQPDQQTHAESSLEAELESHRDRLPRAWMHIGGQHIPVVGHGPRLRNPGAACVKYGRLPWPLTGGAIVEILTKFGG